MNKGVLETLYRSNKSLPVTRDTMANAVASTQRRVEYHTRRVAG